MFFVPLAQTVKHQHDLLQMIEFRSHFMGAALLRSRLNPGDLEPLLRKTFADAGPDLTVVRVRTMKEQIALAFDQQRAVASLAGLFGVVALLLRRGWRLYGVTAYTVVQRTSEIGIRMALGADAGRCTASRALGRVSDGRHRPCARDSARDRRRPPHFGAAVRCQRIGSDRADDRDRRSRCVRDSSR